MGGEGGTPRVDGGVRNDIRWVSEGVGFPLYFGAIDPVFSLVGDTITLPRVLHERAKDANLMRQNHEGELSVARTIPEKLE